MSYSTKKSKKHPSSFYWHDYETFGANPSRDRPVQFAGVRTDLDFNIIDDPLMLYCKPADDMLPHPEACLVTGITPQMAIEQGIPEAEFAAAIHEKLAQPATCTLGYNNLRFDDEVTRYLFYRNFYDPYAREWQNGNSRWDLIDMVRLTYALRPDGIEWPQHEDGTPSFKLEHLSAANGLQHEAAHDALSDVYATISLAKLIKEKQPRLYDYLFEHRSKQAVLNLLNINKQQPVLHTSAMYLSEYGCTAMVVPVASHPTNKNGVIVYDLRHSPADLIKADADEIAERLFTPKDQLAEGVDRIALKTVHINKAPVVVPLNTLNDKSAKRIQIDVTQSMEHLEQLNRAGDLQQKIQQAFISHQFEPQHDPDYSLYGGGFFSDHDRREMNRIIQTKPGQLHALQPAFEDSRLPDMFFRYKARNYADQLNADEQAEWQEFRQFRLCNEKADAGITFNSFEQSIKSLKNNTDISERDLGILAQLETYAQQIKSSLD